MKKFHKIFIITLASIMTGASILLIGMIIGDLIRHPITTKNPITTIPIDTRPLMTFDDKVKFKQACRALSYEAWTLLLEHPLQDIVIADFLKNKILMIEYLNHFDFDNNTLYIDLKANSDALFEVLPTLIAYGTTNKQAVDIENLTNELRETCKEIK